MQLIVVNERYKEVITCCMGMQIPFGMLSKVSIQDFKRRSWWVCARYNQTAAAIDRLAHHCVVLELNIRSLGMEKAKKSKIEKGDFKRWMR